MNEKSVFVKKLCASLLLLLINLCPINLNCTIASADVFIDDLEYSLCGYRPNSQVNSRIYQNSNHHQQHLNNNQPHKKLQGKNGPCWAFAAINALETFLYKKGLFEKSLSEEHLLAYVNQPKNCPGCHRSKTHGGNNSLAFGYFMSGNGPVFESECPYTLNNTCFNSNLSSIKPKVWVKGVKNISSDVSSVKNAVTQFGVVFVVYKVNSNLYHAVTIVGWNDVQKNWIVRDSAQNSDYSSLPFSTELIESCCITDAEPFPENIKIYQHDNFAVTNTCLSNTSLTVANVFGFEESSTLDQITINSPSVNSQINVFLAPVLHDGSPDNRQSSWTSLYSGSVPYAGYFTLNLNNKVRLNKGKYAIIVQINKSPNSIELSQIGYQGEVDDLTFNYERGKSFIFYKGRFVDAKEVIKDKIYFSIKAAVRKN